MIDLEQKFPFKKEHFQVFYHPDCFQHLVGEDHPETPMRLSSILRGCSGLPDNLPVSFRIPQPAQISQLELVHEKVYLLNLKACCQQLNPFFMSQDNHISQNTFLAVLAAGGCVLALAETLLAQGAGFALIRPPGHHASRKNAEGFCFINHVALAIEAIRIKEPEANFLVVDFDVHHGNGIDALYYADPKVFYYSLHGIPEHIYPNTGYVYETGRGSGLGYTRNITLPLESSGDDWLQHFETNLHGFEQKIKPDYLLVSAGFDAHLEDPFEVMKVEDRHFLSAIRQLDKLAMDHCAGRIGVFLEGGYSTTVLERLIPEIISVLATSRKQR
ncbi:MAG: histone deacetylase [Desulfuromonadaceae bacterium]